MYDCMHTCMFVRTYVCMFACMYMCMYVCMHACMHVGEKEGTIGGPRYTPHDKEPKREKETGARASKHQEVKDGERVCVCVRGRKRKNILVRAQAHARERNKNKIPLSGPLRLLPYSSRACYIAHSYV